MREKRVAVQIATVLSETFLKGDVMSTSTVRRLLIHKVSVQFERRPIIRSLIPSLFTSLNHRIRARIYCNVYAIA